MDVAAAAHQGLGQGAGDGVDPLPGGAADEDIEVSCHKLPVVGAKPGPRENLHISIYYRTGCLSITKGEELLKLKGVWGAGGGEEGT